MDGVISAVTLAAAGRADRAELIEKLCDGRLGFARSLGFGGCVLAGGGSAAVERPAREHADGSHMGGA